jgi:O-antigen biosynthesis protein
MYLKNKQVSFVVPLYNHMEHSRKMFTTLKASLPHDLRYEVILVDDGSTDETRPWLASLEDDRVQFIINGSNLGYAKTNNLGVQRANGDYLGLLNNDLLFEPGWFEPMLAVLEAPSLNAGIVGNFQFRVADKTIDHTGVELMPSGKFEHLKEQHSINYTSIPVYAVTGACMLMRREDFNAVGGFDEQFVNGCEDIDLCLKVRGAGKQIYVAPTSHILHHVSLSRSRVSLQNEKNSKYLYSKWRKEIKLQLTKCWVDLLSKPCVDYASYIDGELSHSFKSKPHIAAITIAEAALLREEARWGRDLDQVANCKSPGWLNHVSVSGVTKVPQLKTYLAESVVVLNIDHIKTARNFYLCARLLEDFDPATIAIDLSVNGAQKKTHRLNAGHVVNVGLIDPLISAASNNQLKVEIYFVDANGFLVKPAPHVLLISHFVLDDEVVKPD